ncbi:unnamed protein product [Chrysodeixis includens]|uniref:Uncharacterized protein n=1 Tax=Chrysodeixis includens TaxID=689277 RepID=A0A9P0C2M4_CHRIL|nr:unnamed protein product [Chrysodeixis includens]
MTINEIIWDIPEIPVNNHLEPYTKQIIYDHSLQEANNAASLQRLETLRDLASHQPYLPEQKDNIPKSVIHPELDELAHRFLGPSFENEPDSLADMVISPLSPEPSTSVNVYDPFQPESPLRIVNYWDHQLCLTDSSEDCIPDSNDCSSWSSESSLCSLTAPRAFDAQSTFTGNTSARIENNTIENASTNISDAETSTSDGGIRKRKRKGHADPNEWKKNRRKIRRQSGEPYLSSTGKMIPGKRLTEGRCKGLCREKCTQHFTEDERQAIFSEFWSIESLEQKRQYIVSLIQREEPRTRRTSSTESKRKYTNRYYMKKPKSVEPKRVCQKFFLSTFNISETFVRFCFKKVTQNSEVMIGTVQSQEFG